MPSAALVLIAIATVLGQGPTPGQPAGVERHTAVFDVGRQRMVVFGGYNGNGRNDVWSFTAADTPRWESITPLGLPPAGRFGHSAVYDPAGGRMVVFGGFDHSGLGLDDTWSLALSQDPQWTRLEAGTPPPARYQHTAIVDSRRHRMLLFGGEWAQGWLDDVWELTLGDTETWHPVPTRNLPRFSLRKRSPSAVYDPVGDRMVVFGGFPLDTNDVWGLSLADSTWRQILPGGPGPQRRSGHTAIYDPVGKRMIVYGGHDGTSTRDDVWALSLSDPVAWEEFHPIGGPPPGRLYHSAVYDSLHHRMLVFGGWHGDFASDTWALTLGPRPTWSPVPPVLTVSTPTVRIPIVTVGDTAFATFDLSNLGLTDLRVSAIHVRSDSMWLSSRPPWKLSWGEAKSETLFFAPGEADTVPDTLVIESNDPAAPHRVPVEIQTLRLEFQTSILGAPQEARLGDSLVVIMTPQTGVRIERATLFYRAAGTSAPFDSLPLTKLTVDFIASIPGRAVNERGVEYWVKVENSGHWATHPVQFQPVAAPTAVGARARSLSGAEFLQGHGIVVEASLPLGADFVEGVLHYRRGGENGKNAYRDIELRPAGGVPSAVIDSADVGERGIEYWIEVRTRTATLTYPAGEPAASPEVIPVTITDLVEPTPHPARRFRMLSVPLDFGDAVPRTVGDILIDELGSNDPTRWRAFRYDPSSSTTPELSSSELFRLESGRAYWLISVGGHQIDVNPLTALSTSTRGEYAIVLEPGWNQVGNPFAFPVAWSDVRVNAAVEDPVAFQSDLGTVGLYATSPAALLEPFEGYFIYNSGSAPETLRVPPHEAATALAVASRARETRAEAPELWSFDLRARTDAAMDGGNVLGLDVRASEERDPLDRREPPTAPGPWVSLGFPHRDWRERPGIYGQDVRAPGPEGHVWEVEVRSASSGEPVTIDLTPLADLPADLVVRLIDPEQGSVAEAAGPRSGNPRPEPLGYRLLSFGPERPYRLAIVAGSADYVTRASREVLAVPARLTLDPSEPNPFHAGTRIRFGLPRAGRVTLEVFDVLGQRVATLLDHRVLEPGRHALIWDGKTFGARMAPSGVYFMRLAAGNDVLTRRLVVVR